MEVRTKNCGRPASSSPDPPKRTFWETVLSTDSDLACTICQVRFKKQGHLNMHWRHVHSNAGFPSAETVARMHRMGVRKYACPTCDAWFKRGSDRNRHMRMVHAKIKPFECGVCGNCFGRKSFLEAHILTVHQKMRPYRCDCGATFGQRSSLTRHARKIHGKDP